MVFFVFPAFYLVRITARGSEGSVTLFSPDQGMPVRESDVVNKTCGLNT